MVQGEMYGNRVPAGCTSRPCPVPFGFLPAADDPVVAARRAAPPDMHGISFEKARLDPARTRPAVGSAATPDIGVETLVAWSSSGYRLDNRAQVLSDQSSGHRHVGQLTVRGKVMPEVCYECIGHDRKIRIRATRLPQIGYRLEADAVRFLRAFCLHHCRGLLAFV